MVLSSEKFLRNHGNQTKSNPLQTIPSHQKNSHEQNPNTEWIRIEISSLFKFWRRMHHAKRIKKGLWLWSEKNIIEMLSNESIPHHAYTLRRRSMHSPMAPWLLTGASGPAKIGIDPQAHATCQWISLGWQCGKVNEPVQMDICQVSNEMGEWWRGLGLKESIWFQMNAPVKY